MLAVDQDKVNRIILAKTQQLAPALVAEQSKYGMVHSTNGISKVKTTTRKRDGLISKISIIFKKSGIYREKGAGKGYGGAKGSKWVNAKGELKTTNPKSLNKQGTGNREAAPWLNPVVEKFADQLADELLDEFVEIAFNNLKIK